MPQDRPGQVPQDRPEHGPHDAEQVALCLVFASSEHELAQVAAGVRRVLAQAVPLVGCTTSGEIAGTRSEDASVAVMLLGGPGFTVRTAMARGLSTDSAGTGQRAAQALYAGDPQLPSPAVPRPRAEQPDRSSDVVLLLSDGLSGDQQAMVTGVYRVTGAAIPLVGGCAGDDLRMTATHQLIGGPDGDQVVQDCVVGVRLRSDAPIGIGVRHGWARVGRPVVVTSSDGNQVFTLDDEPALDVYLRLLGAPPQAYTDSAALTRFALDHPLGISGRTQDVVRFVTGADLETRALNLVARMPQGGLAWVMTGDVDSVLQATDDACQMAVDQLHGAPARGILAFDCIARRAVLGASTQDEVDRIGARTDGAPVVGFYTYGEIARTHGMSGFHNQTLVVLALA